MDDGETKVTILDNRYTNTTTHTRLTGYLPPLALLAAAVIWGSSYIVVKDLLEVLDPSLYLCARFAISLPIVAIVFFAPIREWFRCAIIGPKSNVNSRLEYVVPASFLAMAFFTQAYGIQTSSPAVAAFLTSLFFAVVPIFALLHGEFGKLRSAVVPIFVALVGTILLTGVFEARFSLGDTLLILCAVGYAGQMFYTGRLAKKRHFAAAFMAQGFVVLVVGAVVSWMLGEFDVRAIDHGVVLRLLYLAAVATLLCFLLQFWAQKYVDATHVGVILAAEPVAALCLSTILGREMLTLTVVVGAALMVFAAVLSVTKSATSGDTKRTVDGCAPES